MEAASLSPQPDAKIAGVPEKAPTPAEPAPTNTPQAPAAALAPPSNVTVVPQASAISAPSSDVNSAAQSAARMAGEQQEEPEAKRMKPSLDSDAKARARSGRPNGVKCVCRCCGAHGFYQRSCGKKHQCLLGKCGTGAGGAWPGGPEMHQEDATNGAVMYQVTCATCGTALQFALPDSPAYIVCYRCRAKMVIQPMASDAALPETAAVAPPQQEAWPQNPLDQQQHDTQ